MKGISFANLHPVRAAVTLLLLLSACSGEEPHKMVPLTASGLEAAKRQWEAHGSDSYHFAVQVKAYRMEDAVYDLVVRGGEVTSIKHNGQAVRPESAGADYSVSGLFNLLQQELRLKEPNTSGGAKPFAEPDLFVRFDPENGRLDRYRRTTLDGKHFRLQVLEYEPAIKSATDSRKD